MLLTAGPPLGKHMSMSDIECVKPTILHGSAVENHTNRTGDPPTASNELAYIFGSGAELECNLAFTSDVQEYDSLGMVDQGTSNR